MTLKQLLDSPEWAFHCLQGLVSRLLVRGELSRYNIIFYTEFQNDFVKNNDFLSRYREAAAAYVYDPAQRDSRRGLKRSWSKASSKPEGTGSGSTTKEKISSKDKGAELHIPVVSGLSVTPLPL